MDKMLLTRWFWLILFLPFVFAGIRVAQVVWYDASALGPDPAQNLVDLFGTIALWFLCAVLFVTPVQTVIKTRWLLRQRRALGVACFAYALLHWLSYAGLLLEWQWQNLGQDLLNRPYIIVGFLAGLMLAVLAGTSNNTSVRALGLRWRILHRLVYPAALLILIHMFWVARSDYTEVVLYTAVVLLLLLHRWRQRVKPA
ncbi:MAG: sulfoxide reductase heme-binding subunit YedZ [Gammaproteobacteria bacterium]|jgi:sulfoxide reductase heme-binding subunit YedZ|nr:sulfoxide reductase heme-binding subunit YedZ [Gammaproteobacteria bacterium]MBT5053407.1 sulfoxide reductase heme-binding subunit YedZ [Gammaproteobacteria bacterium]MDC0464495.1 sulfoxide reductase heme-binding subunit YedZ [Pseudomonadales bacterium]